ncbi:UTP--glucose-1-phosphate uridylyltransferase [Candidatus Termititenax persephonae]|uniref:UTP--glucose-1-phosphate uridylyltransferase n=1 Tax=Candidatus Termititenax persephonae TaxID=2218525 RepID=A0A388TGP0_9BACT|nr:UTP--glucose-1-phosphate uridylyltransferase [Candidatus Termititenax persephonae]
MLKCRVIAESVRDWEKMSTDKIEKITQGLNIMQADNQAILARKQYSRVHAMALNGDKGFILERDIQPVESLPKITNLTAAEQAHYREIGLANLSAVATVKANGGLATGMNLNKAKNLMEVKPRVTFLDVIARQTVRGHINLVLMNGDSTDADTKEYLTAKNHAGFNYFGFVQGRFPKLDRDLRPVTGNFNPSGTGGFYTSLLTEPRPNAQGQALDLLESLISDGNEYMFFSNGDNLGATVEPVLLGYMIEHKLPFMMEVAERTPGDVKGGHLVYTTVGGERRLTLREGGQVSPDDIDPRTGKTYGENISLHKFFNTNNLWYHLPTLLNILKQYDGVPPLSLVLNPKKDLYQLETVIGTIINLIPGAGAVVVGKSRFAPVKKYNDLFLLWSDVYILDEAGSMNINPRREHNLLPIIKLDSNYFGDPKSFAERVDINNTPSMVNADSLTVKGDVRFGQGVKIIGEVEIDNDGDAWIIENLTLGRHGLKTVIKPDSRVEYLKWTGRYGTNNEKIYRPAAEEEIASVGESYLGYLQALSRYYPERSPRYARADYFIVRP